MKNWSVQKKSLSLSLALLSLTLVIGAVEYSGIKNIIGMKDNITDIQMPSIENVMMIRGRQDSIMLDVYSSIYNGQHGTPELRATVAKDLADDMKDINEAFEAVAKIDASPDVKKALLDIKPAMQQFVIDAQSLSIEVLSGDQSNVAPQIAALEKQFAYLDEHLPKVVDLIVEKSQEIDNETDRVQTKTTAMSGFLMVFGIVGGLILSLVFTRSLVGALNKTISTLTETSHQVSSSSHQSSSSATQLSESATEQAASLQETVASVEEISAMVTQNSESADKAKAAVENNQVATDDGTKSVTAMVAAIDDIKAANNQILTQMESSNREFAEIVKIIAEIGDKTKVINDIVFQTKLLSFNASVEAARAGEHGKGFAVVAEEVGNLAQMSGNAAKEITDMLSASIKKVNEIVAQTTSRVDQLVEIGKDKVTVGQSTAERCRQSLTRISENAHTLAAMVTEISNASKEQAQGVQEINKAMSQLDQVTQQNASVAQLSSQQAEGLNQEAQNLEAAVASIVQIVTGRANGAVSTAATTAAAPAKSASVHPISKSKAKATTKASHAPVAMKKAAGSDVPSSNDPNFENF